MRVFFAFSLALMVCFFCVAGAQADTIVFTGNESDFDPAHLIEDDTVDTELFECGSGPIDPALDIGTVYQTRDATNLYMGMHYDRYCFGDIQLGIALDVRSGGGGTDPFNRQILWPGPDLPDFIIYDVIPTDTNPFNYEVVYEWNEGTTSWDVVNDGSNAWNFVDTDGGDFKEFLIPLSVLGIDEQSYICFEFWVTQDDFGSGTKPAFDMVMNDDQQKSTPGGTTWDVNDGQECMADDFHCDIPGPPVPSASGWALLGLSVVLLTSGILLIARRRFQTA